MVTVQVRSIVSLSKDQDVFCFEEGRRAEEGRM